MPPMKQDDERIRDVMEKGEELFKRGVSFAVWYDWMVSHFGNDARPYLRDAWKHLRAGTTPDASIDATAASEATDSKAPPSSAQGNEKVGSEETSSTIGSMKTTDLVVPWLKSVRWPTFAVGFVSGVVFGYVVASGFSEDRGFGSGRDGRYTFVNSGNGFVIKMDTRTGQTWTYRHGRLMQ